MKTRLFFVIALLAVCLPGIAGADHTDIDHTAFLPHLTGNAPEWQDFLVANNKGPVQQTFSLTLFNAGLMVAQGSYLVQPNEELVIDIKNLNGSATLGMVEYSAEYLTFRANYKNTSGGVAEFRLTDGIFDQVIFNFTNNFGDITDWKGIALANFENFTTDATVYAIGANRQVLDSTVVSLSRRSRIVGLYTEWFPTIALNDITAIIVRSSEAKVAGVTISGTSNNSSLLFTASADATTFIDGSFPSSVKIKDYFPFYDNSGSYDATNDVEISYSGDSGGYFNIAVSKEDNFLRQWWFYFDSGGGLRYYRGYHPMGYTTVSDPFTIVPAVVDLYRLYSYVENWDFVYRYNGSPTGQATIETLVQGPYYVVVPAGAFEEVIKLTIREQSTFSWWGAGSAVLYETVTFWLDKDFGIVKMSINDFEFEVESKEETN